MTPGLELAARALAAALAALAASARADAGPGVVVRPDPTRLVLGTDPGATIFMEAQGDAPPSVSASVGRIASVRALGAGRFAADYLPPREAYPQVAIIGVLAGGRCGFAPIPLVGRGVAIARSVPRSPIRVSIGGETFGPVIADSRGEARVPVVVPPGVRFAYHRGNPLDLDIPATPHVHLLLGRSAAAADAGQDVPLFAFAVTAEGAPRAGAPVEVTVTQGIVDGFAEIAPGTFAARWRLPAGSAGPATATARVADDPAPASTAELARPPGAAARISLEPGRRSITAGEDSLVALRVGIADAAGNPVDAKPTIEATLGTVSSLVATGPGRWEAKLSVPDARGSARRTEIVARAGALEGRVAVELAPGLAVRLALAPASATIVADGGTEARVRVRVLDRFGNDVAIPAPLVEASRGARVAAEQDRTGGWAVCYRPARSREGATEVVSVRAGTLGAAARFELVAAERRVAVAPVFGLGASAGGLRSAYMAAQASYWIPRLRGRLGLGMEVATFVHDRTDTAALGGVAIAIHGRARYIPALASLRWRERVAPQQALWASLGAGLAHVSSSVSASGSSAYEQAGIVPALRASLAWGRRVGPGMPSVELGLSWNADPRFEAFRGALSVFTFGVGYVYDAY